MTRQEYEERRRRLDEELRAGQELLEASHRAQVRALDQHWTAEEGSAAPAVEPPPEKRPRRPALELYDAVLERLDELPEVFTKDDLCRALGEAPDRRALHRVTQDLMRDALLAALVLDRPPLLAVRPSGKRPDPLDLAGGDQAAGGGTRIREIPVYNRYPERGNSSRLPETNYDETLCHL